MNEIDHKYGVPEQKKFPMPDAGHVRSAIRFFNYVEPRYEKELARAILKRMKEYGLTFDDFTVGEENRFSKYIPESELKHHGILGMHWGVRRYQNKDGSWTSAGLKRRREQDGSDSDREERRQKLKKAAVVAGVAIAAGVAAYAGYKSLSANKVTSSSAVRAGSQFVNQMSDMIAPSTVDEIVNSQVKVPKINLTFDATIDPDKDLASQVRNLRAEIAKQTEAIKNSPDMQKYVEELLQRG